MNHPELVKSFTVILLDNQLTAGENMISIPLAEGEHCFVTHPTELPITITGPGVATIALVDRRTASAQRRARGFGHGPQTRRDQSGKTAYGRRSTDKADHEDRRQRASQRRARGFNPDTCNFRRNNSGRRAGDVLAHVDRRNADDSMFARLLGRRSTDIPERRHAPCIMFGGKRTLDPRERRSRLVKVYRSSSDPRVRMLERRNGRPFSVVTCQPPPMAARAADCYIPPENRK